MKLGQIAQAQILMLISGKDGYIMEIKETEATQNKSVLLLASGDPGRGKN